MMYCKYYQAEVEEKNCWLFVGVFRSFEHLAFDRTMDKQKSIFEFFVPNENEKTFLELMNYFMKLEIVKGLKELPSRLLDPNEQV